MIYTYVWKSGAAAGQWLSCEETIARCEHLHDEADVIWVDLENPTPQEERYIFEKFKAVHDLTLKDIVYLRDKADGRPHLPKVEEFPDYLFVIVNPLRPRVLEQIKADEPLESDEPFGTQLSAVLTKKVLVTHHTLPLASATNLRHYLTRHDGQGGRGPDYLFHLILDDMVDQYVPVLERLEEVLDEAELQVFQKPQPEVLERLLRLKRGIIQLRKTLLYEREVLARLSRGEFDLIDERETAYYRNVYDHVLRSAELIESSREMVSDLLQTHLAAASNRLNQVMKVLTMISTTVLPMTLISGIYGMNFEKNVWPDFTDSAYGFPLALALMVGCGVLSFAFFRWMRWI